MEYDVGNVMKTIKELQRRVRQLEVSPRLGISGVMGSFIEMETALITNSTGVWSDFIDGTVEVAVMTSSRALVLMTARPTYSLAFNKWKTVWVGYDVRGATVIDAGDTEGTCRTIFTQTITGLDLGAVSATHTQVSIEENLNPGENIFRMLGMYEDIAVPTSKPSVMCRGLTVIPLDPQ